MIEQNGDGFQFYYNERQLPQCAPVDGARSLWPVAQ